MDDKELLRMGARSERAARGPTDREAAGQALAAFAEAALDVAADGGGVRTVAAYAAVGDEPPTRPLLDALVAAGVRVVLPVVADPQRLDWAAYAGWEQLQPGPWGLLEPAGTRLGSEALAGVALVLVPALAVDGAGHRLGRGGGFYDRALAGVPVARRVAVLYADEVRACVPDEPHDEPVGWALTPSGLRRLAPAD